MYSAVRSDRCSYQWQGTVAGGLAMADGDKGLLAESLWGDIVREGVGKCDSRW